AVVLLRAAAVPAQPAAFDLAGPTLEVEITRGSATLPAAQVPNLAAGDRVWLKADLPQAQSAHYLMVAAFLQGSTNPPPTSWFFRCETWSGTCAKQGLTVIVPKDAQQLLVFLAPVTGGDFSTLVNAVRGRPGTFVRTSQELNQATLDRSRLEAYLAAVRALNDSDPARLKEAAPLLARSLAIKVDEKCLDKMEVLQAPCLMQGQESLILTDGHSASIAQALTSGPASDLAMAASSTPQLKSGYYGPFIGTVIDVARLLDSFHTAQYQYIPALPSADGRKLKLSLNAPPSFHDPKSVLVLAMPAVEAPQFPPLHPVDAKQVYCAKKDGLVLSVDGAPLAFSTAYAHDTALTVRMQDGSSLELPARGDPARGGFAIDTAALRASAAAPSTATLHGFWGFERYDGPTFKLMGATAGTWQLAAGDEASVIIGREDTVHVRAASVSCVESVELADASGKPLKVEWKSTKPDELEVHLALQEASAGELKLLVRQHGRSEPQSLALHAFAEAAHLESFALYSGDSQGVLHGTRLDEVQKLTLKDIEFTPGTLSTSQGHDELSMPASDAHSAGELKAADTGKAHVQLRDGRTLEVTAVIEAPRPSAVLITKSAQRAHGGSDSIRLASADELPQDSRLLFSLRAESPSAFSHDARIEVATIDGAASTVLGISSGGLTLQNAHIAVATLDPARAFGSSAFGPIRFRLLSNGASGDWQPLATLVRLPELRGIECAGAADAPCTLSGSNLFLLDSVSANPAFTEAVRIPDGFTGQALPVPRPTEGRLYVKLRDDPSVTSEALLEVRSPSSLNGGPAPAAPSAQADASSPPSGTTAGAASATPPAARAVPDSAPAGRAATQPSPPGTP
ncbi:MAG TPA: hypothetical protein VEY89_01415, partial [Candidatus Dormibacteraeota bacterium]|nr:hypothetical protein [Candidatus Dormibacteraeota bacterium]